MPELPECEVGRKTAEAVALDRVIRNIDCDDDNIVFDGVEPRVMEKTLKGRTVKAVKRKGKHMWFELDQGPHPLFHFGMTGSFRVPGAVPLNLESSPKKFDASWPPRFSKIHMEFDDGGELVMVNKRRLGRIRLRDDPAGEGPIGKLGFDPLYELPNKEEFAKLLARRKRPLKSLLLDQGFAAGVGNWIADEVLYQANLSPHRVAKELNPQESEAMWSALKLVITKAVSVDAQKTRFPKAWLFHHRWGKKADTDTAGDPIVFETIAGRTTAWVPTKQT